MTNTPNSTPPMTKDQIKARIVGTSLSPTLPPFDARALVGCLVGELETAAELSTSTRDVLFGIAAVLLKHASDEKVAEVEAASALGRAAASRGSGLH